MSPGYQALEIVSWRPLTAADRHAVHELVTASEAFADGVAESTESDLEASWDRPDMDLGRMSLGGFVEGRLAAYAVVFQGRVEASVHPERRGLGLGAHLAKWTWGVARSEGRERVGQTVSDNERSAAALFRALGYERGHTAWILRRKLAAPLLPPALLPGYRFRAYVPGVDGPAIYALIDEAFSEWRNADSEPMGFENWAAYALRDVPPEFVVLLEYEPKAAGDRSAGAPATAPATAGLVGASVGHDHESQGEGWIEQIAVRREHRERGLGLALLEESFRRFLASGRKSAGVSTDSRTGALGLYEHAGMAVVRSYTRWVKTGF
jgi:mycothiol synthase